MGLIDSWVRRAKVRREDSIVFAGELTGPTEDTFKRELMLEFATRPDVRRGYLAQLDAPADAAQSVGLCLVSTRPEDPGLLQRVSEIFSRRFAKDVSLEVVFLTSAQETELAKVCRPFYTAR